MFRLFGFDVHVRTGFVVFLALIVFLYQDQFGVWLAAALAGFTLLHELGHAVAARSAGAHAEISLDFLAGYTSFRADPARPIGRGRRAVISAAGPTTQIVASLGVLYAMGVDPFSLDSVRGSDAAAAIWWAGPAIGALNLIPVLPLDGGHLALTGLEGVLGERALRVMVIASIVVTAGGAALLALTGRPGFVLFIAFLLLSQFQLLQATNRRTARPGRHPLDRSASAEAQAWQTGRPGILEPGQRVSPWYEAHRALTAGDPDRAVRVIRDDLAATSPPRWSPPTAATAAQLRAIVDELPDELPTGNPYSARVLAEIMMSVGETGRAGELAARAFTHLRSSPLATVVARASAAHGDDENALAWLRAAAEATTGEADGYARLLSDTMDRAPEFGALRRDPRFSAVRSELV
jgi:Zn-dependent protease